MLIKSINWIITDVCNLKCKHCDIWQLPKAMADEKLIQRVLNDPLIMASFEEYGDDFDISLGGGEPFTHPKLQDIVNQINNKYPNALKSISTNGVLTKHIFRFLKNNQDLNFKLNISLDGLEETHNNIRGTKDAFKKTIQTVMIIKRAFPRQAIELKMTIMKNNYFQINDVYLLALRLGCQFSCKPVDMMENYTNRNENFTNTFNQDELNNVRSQLFPLADSMLQKKEYKKARFTKDIPFHMMGKKQHTSCSVLWEHITVMVNGDIFYCIKEERAGNIHDNPISKMETKPKGFKCKSCMLMCGSFKDYDNSPYLEKVANIESTLRCNLTCLMCTQKELQTPGNSMSLDTFKKLIESYEIDHMSFIGGESFMNKGLFENFSLLDANGISYELTTNGTLFTDQNKIRLKQCAGLKKINFSLDGTEQYHDRIRGDGVFRTALESLKYAKKQFNVSVATIITKDNLSLLAELKAYLVKNGIHNQKFIYLMNLPNESKALSLRKIPALEIQGPKSSGQVKDLTQLNELFSKLERIDPKVQYEPTVMRKYTKEFLGPHPVGECKQLQQLRFNPNGDRIICEFIRNKFEAELANLIKEERLPICAHCCKMDTVHRIENSNLMSVSS